jgi:hypothetical protein
MGSNQVHLGLDVEVLRPLIDATIEQVLARLELVRATLGPEKIAYTEAEAAGLLSMARHQLRDERLRGRIQASQVVGRQVRYMHADLVAYLLRNRVNDEGRAA